MKYGFKTNSSFIMALLYQAGLFSLIFCEKLGQLASRNFIIPLDLVKIHPKFALLAPATGSIDDSRLAGHRKSVEKYRSRWRCHN